MARSRYTSKFEDLETLRQRFQESRKANRPRTRRPEELWNALAEMAARRGVGVTVRALRLDVNNLKKRMGSRFLRRFAGPEDRRHRRRCWCRCKST